MKGLDRGNMRRPVFNPPPNWPPAPPDWTPPDGWEPDPAWGPPPESWSLWVRPNEDALVRSVVAASFAWAIWLALLFATGDLRMENVVKALLLFSLVPGAATFALARIGKRQWRLWRYVVTTMGLTLVLFIAVPFVEVFLL